MHKPVRIQILANIVWAQCEHIMVSEFHLQYRIHTCIRLIAHRDQHWLFCVPSWRHSLLFNYSVYKFLSLSLCECIKQIWESKWWWWPKWTVFISKQNITFNWIMMQLPLEKQGWRLSVNDLWVNAVCWRWSVWVRFSFHFRWSYTQFTTS